MFTKIVKLGLTAIGEKVLNLDLGDAIPVQFISI